MRSSIYSKLFYMYDKKCYLQYRTNKNSHKNKAYVAEKLKKHSLIPLVPIDQELNDISKSHYSSFATDGKTNYFVKIILKKDRLMKQIITNNSIVDTLSYIPSYHFLKKYTAPLVFYDNEMLIFKELPGTALLLSRSFVNVLNDFPISESILRKLLQIATDIGSIRIPKDNMKKLEVWNWEYLYFWAFEMTSFHKDMHLIQHFLGQKYVNLLLLLEKNAYLPKLIHTHTKYLCHNDFYLGNFLLHNNSLHVVDWDYCALGSKYNDITRLYAHMYEKPHLQEVLKKELETQWIHTKKEKIIALTYFICHAFHFLKMCIDISISKQSTEIYSQTGLEKNNLLIPKRINDLKKLLNELYLLIPTSYENCNNQQI